MTADEAKRAGDGRADVVAVSALALAALAELEWLWEIGLRGPRGAEAVNSLAVVVWTALAIGACAGLVLAAVRPQRQQDGCNGYEG